MKQLVLGILAHVDAGKTTLSEALLYRTGAIRDLGRVDHKNAHLDTHALERARGITIFSRQARLTLGDTAVTLLDTPGHVDFSAEMERTLQVLDYAVLVISGTDGVQAHTETLWQLLRRYRVPVFVFVTKMDLPGADRAALMADLRAHLSGACVDFTDPDPEQIALCDEAVLEQYLDTGALPDETVRDIYRIVLTGETAQPPDVSLLYDNLSELFFDLQIRDRTHIRRSVWECAGEDSLRGIFLMKLKKLYDEVPDDASRERAEQAARWGLAALDNAEEVVRHEDK